MLPLHHDADASPARARLPRAGGGRVGGRGTERATRVFALVSQKGGSSKSTLAVHLAVRAAQQGASVVIVDTDPQATASRWYDRRAAEWPVLATAGRGTLTAALDAARADGVDVVLVDTPPHTGAQIDQAVAAADLVVIPCKPTPFDLDAVPETVRLVEAHRRPAVFVLTSPPARGSIVAEAREHLAHEYPDVPVCPVELGHRASYYHALIDGRAVTEFEPQGKAAAEVDGIWVWLTAQADRAAGVAPDGARAAAPRPKRSPRSQRA